MHSMSTRRVKSDISQSHFQHLLIQYIKQAIVLFIKLQFQIGIYFILNVGNYV